MKAISKKRSNRELSNLEEIIWRVSQGVSVAMTEPLAKKSNKKEVLLKLEEIEREIIAKALNKGLIDKGSLDLDDNKD